jgi:hypothetical protein
VLSQDESEEVLMGVLKNPFTPKAVFKDAAKSLGVTWFLFWILRIPLMIKILIKRK